MVRQKGEKQVRIDNDIYAKIVDIAKYSRTSVTWLVNNILRQAVLKDNRKRK